MSLERYLEPQERTHTDALRELRAGRKVTHWIWWEMPQLASLGRSPRAVTYGLADLEEAKAYLGHDILRKRLLELCEALLSHARKPPEDILGAVDAMKVRSMATLFESMPDAPDIFRAILDEMYGGGRCPLTLSALGRSEPT